MDSIGQLVENLQYLCDVANDCIDQNNMIANPSKFHAILLSNNCNLTDRIPIKIKENLIESETQVDLLGLKINNRLSFKNHISAICKKAARQLNALKRLGMQSINTVIYHSKLQLLSNCVACLLS